MDFSSDFFFHHYKASQAKKDQSQTWIKMIVNRLPVVITIGGS